MKILKKIKDVFTAKRFLRIILYILILLIVLFVAAELFLGRIVKSSIETVGPMIIDVPVSVKSVKIGILGDFRISVRELQVGNPKGYSSPYALKMKKFDLKVKTLSLFTDKVIIDKLLLTGVDVNFETSLFASNLNDIKNNAKKFAGEEEKKKGKKEGKEPSVDKTEKAEKAPLKLQVNTVDISDITVRVIAKGGDVAGVPLMMVPVRMNNLGTEADGITVSGLIGEMFTELFTGVTSLITSGSASVSDSVAEAGKVMGTAAKDAGKDIGSAAMEAGKAVGKAALDARKAVGTAAKDAGKSVGSAAKDAGKAMSNAASGAGKNIGNGLKGLFRKEDK